jgi:hypothetical protein
MRRIADLLCSIVLLMVWIGFLAIVGHGITSGTTHHRDRRSYTSREQLVVRANCAPVTMVAEAGRELAIRAVGNRVFRIFKRAVK